VDAEIGQTVHQALQWSRNASAPRQLAVLYVNGLEQGRGVKLYRRLVDCGLEVFWANRQTAERLGEAEQPVLLASVHSAKGLEFPAVILCGLWRDEEDAESNRRLAYVGMTRAMDRLAVVTTADNPLADGLRGALDAADAQAAAP
jgi:ATP-dependent exoDNAse (exonuclease V) beta subunit